MRLYDELLRPASSFAHAVHMKTLHFGSERNGFTNVITIRHNRSRSRRHQHISKLGKHLLLHESTSHLNKPLSHPTRRCDLPV